MSPVPLGSPNAAKQTECRRLRTALRVFGTMGAIAGFAVFLPHSVIGSLNRMLNFGELPPTPVVRFLVRNDPALYAFLGAIYLKLSTDVDRYLPFVRFLGRATILFGAANFWIDGVAGMPLWWRAVNGPADVLIGLLLIRLVGDVEATQPANRGT